MAAQLAATLSNIGHPTGIGDIHAALYAANPTHFRDVTVGANGAFGAQPGYDEVTGLGSPSWGALCADLAPSGFTCPLTIITSDLMSNGAPLKVGTVFSKQLLTNGSSIPPWTASGPLPPGLSLSPLGVLSGTPTTAGAWTFTVQVSDSSLRTAGRAFTVVVAPLGRFTALPAARIFDHAVGTAPTGIQVAGLAGVPASATAVTANIWVWAPSSSGYVFVTPAGQASAHSLQRYSAGQHIAHLATVALVNGRIQARLTAGQARILIDVSGYYSPGQTASTYFPLQPARIFDHTVGSTAATIVPIAGRSGVARTATAVLATVMVYQPSNSTWMRVTPHNQGATVAATLEYYPGRSIANAVAVKLVNGAIDIRLGSGISRVIVDLSGYFAPDATSDFVPLATRTVFDGAVGVAQQERSLVDFVDVPPWATAVALNVWAYMPAQAGWIRVTPFTQDAGTGTQFYSAGQIISNHVVVKVVQGEAQFRLSTGSARLIVEVSGYYF
jgi:hypothetical protein